MSSLRQFVSKLTHACALANVHRVSELAKICSIAPAFEVKVFPSDPSVHVALHVVGSRSSEVCALIEYPVLHVAHRMHFQKEPLLTSNAVLKLPAKRGFSIELDESKIEKQR